MRKTSDKYCSSNFDDCGKNYIGVLKLHLVSRRLEYCNAMLTGAPKSVTDKLQLIAY